MLLQGDDREMCSRPLTAVCFLRVCPGFASQKARKLKLKRLFKQGVSKVMKERAEEMDRMAKRGALYVMDAFAGR